MKKRVTKKQKTNSSVKQQNKVPIIMECSKCGHKQKVKTKTAVCSICLWSYNKKYKKKENKKENKKIEPSIPITENNTTTDNAQLIN